ncbi:HIT family protein [Patescibacteria group bacterium]|nr:HIT family protein [Patescibacteria group bacterium]
MSGADCIFCKIVRGELPASKVYEDDNVLGFLDIKPVNPGHALVIPKKHFESIHDTPDELVGKMAVASKKIAGVIQNELGAKGVNIGMNNGAAAGQMVFHAHIHVMPRYGKDSFKLWNGGEYKTGGEREALAAKIRAAI